MKKFIKPTLFAMTLLLAVIAVCSLGVGSSSVATKEAFAEEWIYNADTSEVNEEGGYVDYNASTESDVEKKPILAAADGKRYIYNLVIYICFSGEDSAYTALQNNPSYEMLSGKDKSLYDYYDDVSYGKVKITSIYPTTDGGLVAVYQAPNSRSSYQVQDGDARRSSKERSLLMGALEAVGPYFDVAGLDLDANDDGYVDAVSFLISGSSSSDWASLLWPHSWNLESVSGSYTIGGAAVGDFSFNFVDSLTLGVTCHEFFHVLGAPDLYHYSYDFVPVGDWDLMQFDADMPEYSLVYMRQKYLQAIDDSQIATITHNGIYSLKPVTIAGEDEVIAYRINTNKSDEYIMVEYRNPGLSDGYDSSLPGAGLIIYRIKEGVEEGNRNATYHSTANPDEVYVYRPRVASTGYEMTSTTRYSTSRTDVSYAYLSPNNPYFSSVGATLADKPTTRSFDRYDYDTLYYVDGTNTGIIIEAVSISNGSIEFRVKLNKGTGVDDSYFTNKVALGEVAFVNNNEFSGVSATVNTSNDLDITFIGSMSMVLYDANNQVVATNTLSTGKFQEFYTAGDRKFISRFVVSDKGSILQSVFNCGTIDLTKTPVRVGLYLTDSDGDVINLGSKEIDESSYTWAIILSTQSELTAGVACGDKTTFGIRNDGTVVCAASDLGGQWATADVQNVIAIASGATHTLFLKKDLTVSAVYEENYYGENAVSAWTDIVMIAAGQYTSYGLTASGRVYAVGKNSVGQLAVSDWRNVAYIAAGENFVVGISRGGAIYTAGDNTHGQLATSGVSNAEAVVCGNTFSAYLSDGRVIVKGVLIGQGEVGKWSDIVKIAAGKNILLGLKSDGTVVAAGDNSYGQTEVSDLIDIEDLDAGEYHTAFLRLDGVVEFRGTGVEECKTNETLPNLKYEDYVDVASIAVAADLTTLFVAGTAEISVGVLPLDATYKRMVYTSSDTSVATVSPSGVVTCLSVGTAVITVTAHGSGVSKTILFTVREYVELTGVGFASAKYTVLEGKSTQLMPVYTPSNATLDSWEFTYTSNSPARANVTSEGVLEGIAYCETTITMTARNLSTGKTLTATCTAVVVTGIVSINWKTYPTSTVYYYGDEADVSGATFTVTTQSGTSEPMPVTSSMVSGYNTKPILEANKTSVNQSITITYMDKSLSLNVATKDFVAEVKIKTMPTTKFVYGDAFGVGEDGKITMVYASGATSDKSIGIGEEGIEVDSTAYNSEVPGIYKILVNAASKGGALTVTASYNVQVQDVISLMESMIVCKSYNFGESIDPTEQLRLTMKSSVIRTINIGDYSQEDNKVKVEGFDSEEVGTHNITMKYTDPVSGETLTAKDVLTVTFQGEVDLGGFGTGNDSPGGESKTEYIYYYIGEGLPFTVSVNVGSKTYVVKEGIKSGDNIYYNVTGFNNLTPGPYSITLQIMVKSTSGWREVYVRSFNVYGVKEASSTTLMGVGRDYNYGTQITGAYLAITYKDGTSGTWTFEQDAYMYDPELVDVEQTLQFEYLNGTLSETRTIIIHDVVLNIVDIEDKTTDFGEDITVNVYLDMKKGEDRAIQKKSSDNPDGYTISEYYINDASKVGLQQKITITYGELSTSFILVVNDVLEDITMLTGVQTSFKYGQSFSAQSQYTLYYRSGKTDYVVYNDTDFTCLPTPDMYTLGKQNLVIYYRPLAKEFAVTIYVVNYVTSIVPEDDYKNNYKYGEALDVKFTAIYANGDKEAITAADCVTTYNSMLPGNQSVSVRYTSDASTTIYVYVNDGIVELTWLTAPGYTNFKYGEALSLPGAVLQVKFANNPSVSYKGKEILAGEFNIIYNPTKVGRQVVTVSKDGKSTNFVVTIEAESSSTLAFTATDALAKSKDGSELIAQSTMTIAEVASKFVAIDYLTVTVLDKSGTQIDASSEEVMQTGYTVQVINSAGQAIYSYKYSLRGDANGDGYLLPDDIAILADIYNSGSTDNKSVTDSDGDNVFSLTDLVKAARKATENSKSVNDIAKEFISDVKTRKQEESEENERA